MLINPAELLSAVSPSTCRQCYLQDLPEVSEPYQDRSSVCNGILVYVLLSVLAHASGDLTNVCSLTEHI